ncbi:MAG TPA: hypothetical protein VJ654_15440 [Noviherbaspirillum sp.]|nr:hypothetical protein [Noviherbaspirillum sp.]
MQQFIQSAWKGLQNIDFGFVETALNKLMQFDKFRRSRKIEMFVIPTLRNTSREAEELITELERISAAGLGILHSLNEQLTEALSAGRVRFGEICQAMQVYCYKASIRLKKEEEELWPMVRRLFSTEEGFAIAAQFLSDDSDAYGRRRHHTQARAAEQISTARMYIR